MFGFGFKRVLRNETWRGTGLRVSRFRISMANVGRVPRFQPQRLGVAQVPAPLASLGGRIPRGIRWRPGSKIARVDAMMGNRPYHWRLGPTHASLVLSVALHERVHKAEVSKVLKSGNHTRKKISIVPATSRPNERFRHLNALCALGARRYGACRVVLTD